MNKHKNKHSEKCSSCGSKNINEILKIKEVPAHCCLLWENREDAINCPKGDIRLCFCNDCGHLYNQAFNPDLMEYTQDYENSLHFSPKFQEYSNNLIRRLTETYNLYNKDIIEIGCGKGSFAKIITSKHYTGLELNRKAVAEAKKEGLTNGIQDGIFNTNRSYSCQSNVLDIL